VDTGSFLKYRNLLEDLIADMQSPVTTQTHPGYDGCPESGLIKRVSTAFATVMVSRHKIKAHSFYRFWGFVLQ
jgi:hypothetical protein